MNELLRAFAARPLYYGGVIFLYCLMILLIINVIIASFEWWL